MDLEVALVNEFYKDGFFGYGEFGDYKPFSMFHFLPIIIAVLIIVFIYFKRNKIRNSKHENTYRLILGLGCLFTEFGYFWRILYVGSGYSVLTNLLTKLPLQVCEWSCIFAVVMLLNKNEFFYQYCSYVCLSLGLIPLIITDVISNTGPSYFRYYQFWTEHLLPIIGVFYMSFVHGFRPKKYGLLFPVIFLSCLGIIAIQCNNHIPYASYFYLNSKYTNFSFLPKNKYALLAIMALIALFIIFPLIYKIFTKIKAGKES